MRLSYMTWLAPTLLATVALAHGGVKDPVVMARMDAMVEIGQNMKLLGQMTKKEITFDAMAARTAARHIAVEASEIVARFEDPATDPKSEALPTIWEDFSDFSAKAGELQHIAESQAGTIMTYDDLKTATSALLGTCKACHLRYKAD